MQRIDSLDSLRGIAALTVVYHHCLLVFPAASAAYLDPASVSWPARLLLTPFYPAWAGHEAVVLFFVLSGFVLSLAFTHGQVQSYPRYAVKRLVRLYVPYAFALLASSLLFALTAPTPVEGHSAWFNGMWSRPIDLSAAVDLLLLRGQDLTNNHNVNSVTWSLLYEIRISLLFPLLMLAVLRSSWPLVLILAAVLSFLGATFGIQLDPYFQVGKTAHYTALFLVGALVGKHREDLVQWWSTLARAQRTACWGAAFAAYTWRWHAPFRLGSMYEPLEDWAPAAAAALMIVAACRSERVHGSMLRQRWLQWLGRVSYSLYLVHIPMLLTVVHAFGSAIPPMMLLLFVPPLSLIAAELTYRATEEPGMRLGRRLASAGLRPPAVYAPEKPAVRPARLPANEPA